MARWDGIVQDLGLQRPYGQACTCCVMLSMTRCNATYAKMTRRRCPEKVRTLIYHVLLPAIAPLHCDRAGTASPIGLDFGLSLSLPRAPRPRPRSRER